MSKPKLHYFNLRGRAEGVRFTLAQAGVDYDDTRMKKEEWVALKPTMPFGQVPAMEIDGRLIAQSVAIGRYVARKHGLAGRDDLESAMCDMIVDGAQDMLPKMRPIVIALMAHDADKLRAEMDLIKQEALPSFFASYTKLLAQNGGQWFVGDDVTWADLWVAELMSRMISLDPQCMTDYPEVKAHMERVLALPKIAEYVKTRPKTDF